MSGRPRARHRHRRSPPPSTGFRLAVLGVLVLTAALATVAVVHFGLLGTGGPRTGSVGTAAQPAVLPTGIPVSGPPSPPGPSPSPSPTRVVTALNVPYPKSGPGTFRFATTTGPVLGTAGRIRHFRLAIESNITVVSMAEFAAKVNQTLGDPRSWIAGGAYRLQQVAAGASYEFTIYLVTEATSTRMCAGLNTGGYTSCREGAHVVLNLDRWMSSIPGYVSRGVPLETYRAYMINHEVGHALGHGHELCPKHGALAPVMEQQTLGLHGCLPNAWPYVNGKKYDGPPGTY